MTNEEATDTVSTYVLDTVDTKLHSALEAIRDAIASIHHDMTRPQVANVVGELVAAHHHVEDVLVDAEGDVGIAASSLRDAGKVAA